MKALRSYGPWTIRLLISGVFFLSAFSKLYPNPVSAITMFEIKQLAPLGFSPQWAQYLSRTLIGVELAIGILLLLPYYLRRVIIPGTILLLLIFIVELIIEIILRGNKGACGCFGTLITMTPLDAIIKNALSVGLLVWFYFLDKKKDFTEDFPVLGKRVHALSIVTVFLSSILFMYLIAPLGKASSGTPKRVMVEETENSGNAMVEVTQRLKSKRDSIVDNITALLEKQDLAKKAHDNAAVVSLDQAIQAEIGKLKKVQTDWVETKKINDGLGEKEKDDPVTVKSGFEDLFPDINDGNKLLCFFAPGCDHCRETVKILTQMKKTIPGFPSLRIAFMDEEAELIPDFFKVAGSEYSYTVLDIMAFWKRLGSKNDVPGVLFLKNGKLIKMYQGIDNQKFDKEDFKKVLMQ